jgi:hypothetical protein
MMLGKAGATGWSLYYWVGISPKIGIVLFALSPHEADRRANHFEPSMLRLAQHERLSSHFHTSRCPVQTGCEKLSRKLTFNPLSPIYIGLVATGLAPVLSKTPARGVPTPWSHP